MCSTVQNFDSIPIVHVIQEWASIASKSSYFDNTIAEGGANFPQFVGLHSAVFMLPSWSLSVRGINTPD